MLTEILHFLRNFFLKDKSGREKKNLLQLLQQEKKVKYLQGKLN